MYIFRRNRTAKSNWKPHHLVQVQNCFKLVKGIYLVLINDKVNLKYMLHHVASNKTGEFPAQRATNAEYVSEVSDIGVYFVHEGPASLQDKTEFFVEEISVRNKQNCYWGQSRIPLRRSGNAKRVYISWYHHALSNRKPWYSKTNNIISRMHLWDVILIRIKTSFNFVLQQALQVATHSKISLALPCIKVYSFKCI